MIITQATGRVSILVNCIVKVKICRKHKYSAEVIKMIILCVIALQVHAEVAFCAWWRKVRNLQNRNKTCLLVLVFVVFVLFITLHLLRTIIFLFEHLRIMTSFSILSSRLNGIIEWKGWYTDDTKLLPGQDAPLAFCLFFFF